MKSAVGQQHMTTRRHRIGLDARFLTETYPGIARYVYNLACGLGEIESEDDILLLVPRKPIPGRYDSGALERSGLHLHRSSVPPRSLREQTHLARFARRSSLDLFHSPFWWTSHMIGCPLAVTLYDLTPLVVRRTLRSRSARLAFLSAIRRVAKKAELVFTLTEASRLEILGRLPIEPERVVVTPAAPDPRFLPAPKSAVSKLRSRLGLAEPYALFIGTNKPHKNLLRLIEAWSRIESEGESDCRLVVAGAWDLRYPEARTRARELGLRVSFLSSITEPDLPALYSGARLLVLPSLSEGFGFPLVEAMACGVPVACSRIASLLEVAGEAALFFEPTDTGDMAAGIRRLLWDDDLGAGLARLGSARAGELSWRRTAQLTMAGYRRLL